MDMLLYKTNNSCLLLPNINQFVSEFSKIFEMNQINYYTLMT